MTVEVETMVATLMPSEGHLNLRASSSAPTPISLSSSSSPPLSCTSSASSSSSSSPSPSASHSPTASSSEPLLRLKEGQRASKRKQTHPIRSIKKTEGDLSRFIVLNFCQTCALPGEVKGAQCCADQKEPSLETDDLDLADSEKEFCASIGLSQSHYLKLREVVIKEGPKAIQKPTFKKKVKLDVTKTKRLVEFFSQPRFQSGASSPKS